MNLSYTSRAFPNESCSHPIMVVSEDRPVLLHAGIIIYSPLEPFLLLLPISVTKNHGAEDLKEVWLEIGRKNPWIREAYDPPFNAESFSGEAACASVQELVRKILRGNWCLGTAYYFEDICFINQVNGGDEWLTVKGRTPFESITFQTFSETEEKAKKRAFKTIECIRRATEEQCRRLEY